MKNMTGAIYVAGALDYETRKRVSASCYYRKQKTTNTDSGREKLMKRKKKKKRKKGRKQRRDREVQKGWSPLG